MAASTASLVSSKCQTLLSLTVVLWKYQVFGEIQLPVTTDGVIGMHEYNKSIKEQTVHGL